MGWFWLAVIIISLFKAPVFGILVAIVYGIYWIVKISSPQTVKQNDIVESSNRSDLSVGNLADLVLLRLELQTLLKSEQIDNEQYTDLIQRIDDLCTGYLSNLTAIPDSPLWRKHRDAAWDLLNESADTPLGLPPWRKANIQDFASPLDLSKPIEWESTIKPSVSTTELSEPAASFNTPETAIPEPSVANFAIDSSDELTLSENAATFTIDEADHSTILPYQKASVKLDKTDSTLNQYAWKPHEPSRLEGALTTLSGWHSLAVPFLAQNIGWFIGVFCFIAGSMFLVSYATGYAKNLIAFFAFFIFTLALLFGGYQLRHKRPELETSSYVIFILSLLLIPLTNITATQLLMSSDSLGLQSLSALLVLVELGVFYFTVTLVSGLMGRSLQQGLPKFFLALTATQLLQVLLLALPFWQLLAVIHFLIFALLSVGTYLFTSQWLQSIFVDQHKISYFAAGTLIYAAVVSFVFITVGNAIVLPAGYYGFFLMLLCGLLFFIDVQLKQWIEQHAALSRFSFLVYGLSVLALCMVAQYQTAAILTLILAIGLYAFIVWSYLTLTPLTILLVCYFWLYSLLVLQLFPNLPDAWYFLASLPLLFSLYRAANWALHKHQSTYLAVIIFRVLYGVLASLTIWSLSQSEAGLAAMLTAITASVLIYYTLKAAPIGIFSNYSQIASSNDVINRLSAKQNLLTSRWFYSIPALCAITVFYTPRLASFTDELQFSLGLLLLSGFWTYQGLNAFFKAHSTSETTAIEQRLNSALFSLLLVLLAVCIMPDHATRIAPLFLLGMILLWLSIKLLTRWLFYLVLMTWCAAFALLKLTYFPAPSNGLVTVSLGIGIWFWLWRVERQASSELIALRREQIEQKMSLLPTCRLLSWFDVPSSNNLFREVMHAPLEQFMCLLWLVSMKSLAVYVMAGSASYVWLVALFLASLFSVLLIIRYLLIKLLALPIGLLLSALLMMLLHLGWNLDSLLLVSVLFALVIWRMAIYALAQTWFIKLADALNPDWSAESEAVAQITHITAFFIVFASVILQLLTSDNHSLSVLLTLISTAWFFWLSDRSYEQIIVRYFVLFFSVLSAIELVSLTLYALAWQTLITDGDAALLFVLLSLAVGILTKPTNSYTQPSAITAIWLVFISVFLQLLHITQITAIITPLDYTVLFLAGFSLLLANAKLKSTLLATVSFMLWVLAVLWLENSIFHAQQPFNLWLGTTFADLWLLLGLLSLAMSLLFHWLRSTQKGEVYYLPALNTAATLCFVWTLLGTLTLFFASGGQADWLAILLLVSLLTLFSLSKNRSGAAEIRGFASACLSTLIVFSLVLPAGLGVFELQTVTVITGYALWCCASFILPSVNKRYNDWTIEAIFFPYLGFLLVIFSACWWQALNTVDVGIYFLELSIYCLLMLRYSSWTSFAWLASFTLTAAVIAFNFDSENLPINLLLWGNVQLLLVTVLQRKVEKLAELWQWKQAPLALAFQFTSKFIFVSYLLITSIVLWVAIVDNNSRQNATLSDNWLIGILLNLSFLHLLWLRFSTASLHGFIYTLLLSLWAIYFTCLNTLFHPPTFLTLWSLILFASIQAISRFRCPHQDKITAVITDWVKFFVTFATIGLVYYPFSALAERLLSMVIVIGLSVALGKRSNSPWLVMAKFEFLLLLHIWPFLLVDVTNFNALLPWYALQITLFAYLSSWLLTRLATNAENSEHQALYENGLNYSAWLIALGLLELGVHGVLFQQSVMSGISPNWLFAPFDAIAALSTGVFITIMGLRHVRYTPDSSWLYGIVLLVGGLAFYSRLLWLGAAAVSLWDTAVLMAAAYILFFLQRLFPSKPLLNSALLMPALALLTVPLQLASPETSLTLMVSAVLYALMRRHSQQKMPLYLALIAFNAAVYLWVPSLVNKSQLIQVYVIPAALSSLMLLHLHSRELKPSVLMGSRLAAISSIYACATADVFLHDEQSILVFILAMGLSIAGILLGIALRTRAFLYAGVSFLLLNVIGQLLRFYPEQGIGKAIVLMVMGFFIISLMIWFNIKRIAILQRIHAIQAEMQTWQ